MNFEILAPSLLFFSVYLLLLFCCRPSKKDCLALAVTSSQCSDSIG